jgi:hypothetical protein
VEAGSYTTEEWPFLDWTELLWTVPMFALMYLGAVFGPGVEELGGGEVALGVGIVAATLLYLASELRRPAALTSVLLHPEGTLFEERKECTLVYLPDRSGSTT